MATWTGWENLPRVASGHPGPNIEVVNPFSHSRSLIGDFQLAEEFLTYGIRQVHNYRYLSAAPRVIMHPLEKIEGGLTDLEACGLEELATDAGATEVIVHTGTRIDTNLKTCEKIRAAQKSD